MKQITKFSELKEGQKYSLYSKQFDVTNEAVLITKDYSPLNRDIVYFQFTRSNEKPITKERFIYNMKNNYMTFDTFAMWDWEIDDHDIYEI
jgi:hypothetical protein